VKGDGTGGGMLGGGAWGGWGVGGWLGGWGGWGLGRGQGKGGGEKVVVAPERKKDLPNLFVLQPCFHIHAFSIWVPYVLSSKLLYVLLPPKRCLVLSKYCPSAVALVLFLRYESSRRVASTVSPLVMLCWGVLFRGRFGS